MSENASAIFSVVLIVAGGFMLGSAWTQRRTVPRSEACPIFFEARDTVDVLREFPGCVVYLPEVER